MSLGLDSGREWRGTTRGCAQSSLLWFPIMAALASADPTLPCPGGKGVGTHHPKTQV